MTDKSSPDESNEETSEEQAAPASIGLSISSNSALLGFFALLSTAIIAGTFLGTEDKIIEQKRQAQLKALYQIVPPDRHDNDMLKDNIDIQTDTLGHRKIQRLFLARNNLQPQTLIYPVTARDGYSGDIDFIVGVNTKDGSIAGVRVLSHKETPGLGDKVDLRKSDWVLAFNNRRLGDPDIEGWAVKKDGGIFDGFTGATITPRAVTASIVATLHYHHQNVEVLLKKFEPAADAPPSENK